MQRAARVLSCNGRFHVRIVLAASGLLALTPNLTSGFAFRETITSVSVWSLVRRLLLLLTRH